MCLLALHFRVFSDAPIFLMLNRDESVRRPSTPPRIVREDDGADWIGGRDKIAGGTWLGVNQFGLVVAVTNRRDRPTPQAPRSRGLLCRDLLTCATYSAAVTILDRLREESEYAGFNLLLASRDGTFVLEHGSTTRRRQLDSGLHVLSNTGLNDAADVRASRARREFEALADDNATLQTLIASGKTISGLTATDSQPGLCHCGGSFGTVSASVIAVTANPADAEYWHAAGPPCRTAFESHTDDFRKMMCAYPQIEDWPSTTALSSSR